MGATPLILATKATSWVVRADEGHSCHVFPVIAAQLIAMFSSAVGNRAPPVFFSVPLPRRKGEAVKLEAGWPNRTARRESVAVGPRVSSQVSLAEMLCSAAHICWIWLTWGYHWRPMDSWSSWSIIILCIFMRKENTDQSTCLTPTVLPQPQHILQWWLMGTQIEAGTTIQHSFFIFFWMVLVGHQIKSASFPRVAKYRLYRLYI